MNHEIRINLDDADRAHALARSVNDDSFQSGLYAEVRGAEITIGVANPLLCVLFEGIAGVIAWFRRVLPTRETRDASVADNELPQLSQAR